MFYFAHPAFCPDCRTPRTQSPRCERCGLLVTGERAERLYALLAEADAVLEQLRLASPPPVAPTPVAAAPAAAGTRPSRITVGSVLLALGALLLVVAATVFVAVAWGSLSLAARTVLLLGVTGIVAGVAVVCVRRTLRASAEALWAVTSLMLLVDLAAAYAADLAGIGDLGGRGLLTATAIVLALPSIPAALSARRRWADAAGRTVLATAEVAVVAGSAAAVGALTWDWPYDEGWLPIVALALLAAAAAGALLVGLRVAGVGLGGLAVASYAAGVLSALTGLEEQPALSQVVGDSGWQTLVLLVVSVAVAAGTADRPPVPAVAALVASALAAALLVVPAAAAGEVPAAWVTTLVAVALAAIGALPSTGWADGVRVAAALGAVGLLALLSEPTWRATEAVVRAATPVWGSGAGARLDGDATEPAWMVAVPALGLAALAALAARWHPPLRSALESVAGVAVVGGALATVASYPAPVAVLTVAAVAGAAVVGAAVAGRRPVVLVPAAVVVSVGSLASLGSAGLTAAAIGASAGALLARAVHATAGPAAAPLSAVGFVLADAAALAAAHALGATGDLAPVVVVTTGTVVVTALAGWLTADRWSGPGLGAELAGVLGLVVSLAVAAPVGPGTLAVTLTVLGGVAALVGLLRAGREPARWLGFALLQAAWTVRLVDTDVEVVEVYTLPAGLLLTAVGTWTLLRDPQARTVAALLPGLGLAVLPSLPQALLEPTSARGWLVGAAGVALVLAAVRMRWFAPLAVGGAAAAVVALAHLVSAAQAVPRWVTLAAVGAALLAAGITWESRVRQARALATYVGDLR